MFIIVTTTDAVGGGPADGVLLLPVPRGGQPLLLRPGQSAVPPRYVESRQVPKCAVPQLDRSFGRKKREVQEKY